MKSRVRSKLFGVFALMGALITSPSYADSEHWHTGVNVAGAEFGSNIPGTLNRDYVYPNEADLDYFIDHGLVTFRVPFKWERVQPEVGGPFSSADIGAIDAVVDHAASRGAKVLLDPHNYGKRYLSDGFKYLIGSSRLPTEDFVAFWVKLANRYKDDPHVIFGLMNEPHNHSAGEWRAIMDEVVPAIRKTGAKNLILVPGTNWDGAHSWTTWSGNAEAFETFVDPGDNFAFEAHQYFDSDSSGRSDQCVSETIGVERIRDFTQWLRDHGHRGFLGEFGVATNSTCMEALDNALQHIGNNSDVWVGWSYWSAGRWWGDYMFSVHPEDGKDKPQLAVLKKHMGDNTSLDSPSSSPENQPPTADYNFTTADLTASFTDASADSDGSVSARAWDFGDGTKSSQTSPSHTYGAAGTYVVTLTVTDDDGASDSTSKSVSVTEPANESPQAGFTFSTADLAASFTDASADADGSISERSWDFGDGSGSTKANPSHSYGAAGTYTVTLTVTDDDGATDSASKSVSVTAPGTDPENAPPAAGFTFTTADLSASFTDASTDSDGSIAARSWDFGDGTNSSEANPSHSYGAAGTYTVTLTVTDDDGASGSTSQSVSVSEPGTSPDESPSAGSTLAGVNLAGGEFSGSTLPGRLNWDYIYPTQADLDYFIDNGLTTFRLPFKWERVQPTLGGALSSTDIGEIDKVVAHAASRGAKVILDVHNYGERQMSDGVKHLIGSNAVPTAQFAAFWAQLAQRYKDDPNVIFGLMNGIHDQTAGEWRAIMDEVVVAIRATGATNLILVPGTNWGGAHSWTTWSGNADAFETFVDPGDNFAFEVHQFFDSDSSGLSDQCVSETIGADRLKKFTQWLRDQGHRGFLGGFGVAVNATCMAALDNALQYIGDNTDVWEGWTYWAAGRWWGSYMFSVHPQDGQDKPQLAVLQKHAEEATSEPPAPENQPPAAGFTFTTADLSAGFADASTDADGSIAARSWDFGDGTTSSEANPSHAYGAAGTYTVTLTVTDDDGATDSTSQSVSVTAANQPPQAGFTFTTADLSAGFTDASTDGDGSIAARSWDFGDGTTSSEANPPHTYGAAGTYTVTLTVTDDDGATDSTSQSVSVTAPEPEPSPEPEPDAEPAPPSGFFVDDGPNGAAMLSWVDESDNETGFEIQREYLHANGRWLNRTVFGVGADITEYVDDTGAGTFRYRIRSVNSTGSSVWVPVDFVEVTVTGGEAVRGLARGK